MDMSKKVTRLYEQFQPEHYDLTLDVDRTGMSFSGSVTIRGKKVGRPSQRLTLHQKDLKISQASAVKHDKNGEHPVNVTRINAQDSFDEIRLHSDDMIYPGDYSITMEFSGKINDQMHGIYPCYFRHEGTQKTILATQFESHHAREAFPCIDEPEAKATFDFTLITDEVDTALSNMPAIDSKVENGRQTVRFETSPKMSSYLLAFATGEMQSVEGKAADGTIVKSWATVAQPISHLNYANDEAIKVLDFFIDYFDTPFPLPKVDQVALPDFDSLAMENWGLITFREVGLLADPVNRSISSEQLITLVIAHELSHQWFGNLVTMKWWDDLWLNESFASIMENIAPDSLHPDWHQWEDFSTGRAISAAQRDIYKDVQSVSVEVTHPDEITTLFDPAIVYAKGARLLNMLYEYVGEDNVRAALKNYFEHHAYGNTTRDDLWKELSEVSGQDIEKLMTPWLRQSGMPLVRVSERDGDTIKLSQQRFLLDGEDKDSIWPVPLLSEPTTEPMLLDKRTGTVTCSSSETPIFNIHGTGHYIVYYEDVAVRKALHARVVDRTLESTSRINVLNDMLLLSRSGESSIVEILEVIKQCSNEPRDAVWTMFNRALGNAHVLTDGDTATDQKLRAFKAELAQDWYKKLGWEDATDDDPNTKHLRSTVLALSIAGEVPDAVDTALKMYENAGSAEKLPAEQRAMVAGAAVRFGKPESVDNLMKEYAESQSSEVQESVIAALCSTRDPKVAEKIVAWGLLPGTKAIRPQDIAHWFAYLMRNYHTREVAWKWVTENWDHLVEYLGGGKHLEYFIWYASGPLSTPEWQHQFVNFFEPKLKDPSSTRNIKIAFGEIEARVQWRKREEASIKKFFTA